MKSDGSRCDRCGAVVEPFVLQDEPPAAAQRRASTASLRRRVRISIAALTVVLAMVLALAGIYRVVAPGGRTIVDLKWRGAEVIVAGQPAQWNQMPRVVDAGRIRAADLKGGLVIPTDARSTVGAPLTIQTQFCLRSTGAMPMLISHGAWSREGYFLQVFRGRLRFHVSGAGTLDGGPIIQPGRWYRVECGFDGARLRMQVDGAPAGEVAAGGLKVVPRLPLRLGCYVLDRPQYVMDGLLGPTCVRAGYSARPPAPGMGPMPGTVTDQWQSHLSLVKVSPAAGAVVSKSTVIVADLSYRIDAFKPGIFRVFGQVASNRPGMTTGGSFGVSRYPVLKKASGTLRFAFPASCVWTDKYFEHPLRIWFCLARRAGSGGYSIVATVGPVAYVSHR